MIKPINYPHDTEWTLERGEWCANILVEYGVEERGSAPSGLSGPPENYDPGSGWVFYIKPTAVGDDGVEHTLTSDEYDAIHSWLEENHEEDDGWYDYD